jgi:hypothetical protein
MHNGRVAGVRQSLLGACAENFLKQNDVGSGAANAVSSEVLCNPV